MNERRDNGLTILLTVVLTAFVCLLYAGAYGWGKRAGRAEQAKIDAAHHVLPASDNEAYVLGYNDGLKAAKPPVVPESEQLKYFLQGRNQQKLEQVAKCDPPWILSVERINGLDYFTCKAPAPKPSKGSKRNPVCENGCDVFTPGLVPAAAPKPQPGDCLRFMANGTVEKIDCAKPQPKVPQ